MNAPKIDRELHRRIVNCLLNGGAASATEIADAIGRDPKKVKEHLERESFVGRKGRSEATGRPAMIWDLTQAARYPPSRTRASLKEMSHPDIEG